MLTALTLARLGTVNATAADLGVHRATVNRHIETLESAFGARLFYRHARGYAVTEAGRDLLEVASQADDMFSDLQNRARSAASRASGKLIISMLSAASPTIMPAIQSFRLANPDVPIECIAEAKLSKLEYGEAHIAFRIGPEPVEPDYVVRKLAPLRFGLYASESYVQRRAPITIDTLAEHAFVGPMQDATYLPYLDWLIQHIPPSAFVLRSNNRTVRRVAICHGLGVGFLDEQEASLIADLHEVVPPSDAITINLWVVTHVDLHRSAKVQAFLKFLR